MTAQGNADVVEAISDAVARRDLDALIPLLDPDIEHRDAVHSTALHGREEMRRHFVCLWRESPEASFSVDEVLAEGDWVVARQTWSGLSGGELITWVARRFVNRKVRQIEVHATRAEALEAAGLRA